MGVGVCGGVWGVWGGGGVGVGVWGWVCVCVCVRDDKGVPGWDYLTAPIKKKPHNSGVLNSGDDQSMLYKYIQTYLELQ